MNHDKNNHPHIVALGHKGRFVLPIEIREQLHLKEGDRFVVVVNEDHSLKFVSLKKYARQGRGLLKELGVSLADELIAERPAEAEPE
ncbi:AbrB/MazE/SpoVT family DNA-binding domain-containing protein [Cyanobacteria bacterium FACHB-63]|nr:AbrB/MazE/SpoVT family DNA-binding domain-containing protein [Cyanobacteria bacterium FACHB-63]